MKIIKEGKLQTWSEVYTCFGCSAELEVSLEDLMKECVETIWGDNGYGREKYRVFFICPCCKKPVFVP